MQRTAYEMRISDWSSVVCSSDLLARCDRRGRAMSRFRRTFTATAADIDELGHVNNAVWVEWIQALAVAHWEAVAPADQQAAYRSEEHTSELQSLMRISYAVFCLKKKKKKTTNKENLPNKK